MKYIQDGFKSVPVTNLIKAQRCIMKHIQDGLKLDPVTNFIDAYDVEWRAFKTD